MLDKAKKARQPKQTSASPFPTILRPLFQHWGCTWNRKCESVSPQEVQPNINFDSDTDLQFGT